MLMLRKKKEVDNECLGDIWGMCVWWIGEVGGSAYSICIFRLAWSCCWVTWYLL